MCGGQRRDGERQGREVALRARELRRDPSLRVGDAERDRTVDHLRRHAAIGRLDADELEDRVGRALRARTGGDLVALTADLPKAPKDPARVAAKRQRRWREEARAYALVMTILLVVWLATGAGFPWVVFPALGWGLPLLAARPRRRAMPALLAP